MAVLHLPPYYEEYSAGKTRVSYGVSESEGQTTGNSVSLNLKADVGWGGDIPFALKASVSTTLSTTQAFSQSESKKFNVKTGYNLGVNTEKFGNQYAGVVLAWGCYHGYTYRVEDPAGLLAANEGANHDYMVTIPVGGGSTMWSSNRYNTLAAKKPGLPQVVIPHTIGDPSTYPTSIQTVAGSIIPEDDMVFPNTTPFTVSDIGSLSWGYTASEFTTNAKSLNTSVSGSAKVTVTGFSFGTGVGVGNTDTYNLSVGTSTTFSGLIPAVPDDPETATDEFLLYGYNTIPFVYRHNYTTDDGTSGGFYVVYYAVP